MKCAKEFVEIRKQVNAENAEYEMEQNLKAANEYLQACVETTLLCETRISDDFTKEAKKIRPNNNVVSIDIPVEFFVDRLGNKMFRLVIERKNDYADGSSSFGCYEDKEYSYKTLIDYLAPHCFKVSVDKSKEFSARCFGWGLRSWPVITITTEPEC